MRSAGAAARRRTAMRSEPSAGAAPGRLASNASRPSAHSASRAAAPTMSPSSRHDSSSVDEAPSHSAASDQSLALGCRQQRAALDHLLPAGLCVRPGGGGNERGHLGGRERGRVRGVEQQRVAGSGDSDGVGVPREKPLLLNHDVDYVAILHVQLLRCMRLVDAATVEQEADRERIGPLHR
eukprot:scaffold43123_cov56-Phaeocystis_antarctica.AAC.2